VSPDFEVELEVEPELDVDELLGLLELVDDVPSDDLEPESDDFEVDSPSVDDDELVRPLVADDDERESVMYQPLPLKTIPTGWITLRSAPPHCSQVVRGGSEKLWRFSTTSLQAVQVYV
jgi:hypothetical protein